MKKFLIFVILVAAVGVLVFLLRTDRSLLPGSGDEGSEDAATEEDAAADYGENTIVYTDDGFSPVEIIVSVGEIVTFVNDSSRVVWPATAEHPTHTVYPGSDITKCDSAEAADMFDSCGPVMSDESWSFAFDEVGEWGYHDHLDSSYFGKVIVE
ncbi:hypothetical protein CL629_01660 [bacterium]|nr:hypothetical protein [bacterium]|tara:strand:- start:4994 stop:5455 length:462 start_codon:yes stop_codon:yes gene_type:complete